MLVYKDTEGHASIFRNFRTSGGGWINASRPIKSFFTSCALFWGSEKIKYDVTYQVALVGYTRCRPRCLHWCLEGDNGSDNSAGALKRDQTNVNLRRTTDRWRPWHKCLKFWNHCMACISSFNTWSHSIRQRWFNTHVTYANNRGEAGLGLTHQPKHRRLTNTNLCCSHFCTAWTN